MAVQKFNTAAARKPQPTPQDWAEELISRCCSYKKPPLKTTLEIIAKADLSIVDDWGHTALMGCAKHNYSKIAAGLISQGVDLDIAAPTTGNTALVTAIWSHAEETALLLIRSGAALDRANEDGSTPLHIAAWLDKPVIVQALIDAGAIDCVNKKGETGLHLADVYGHDEVAQILVAARSRPETIARKSFTAAKPITVSKIKRDMSR